MKYIVGAILISSLIFFIVALLISATGFKPAQNILPFGWLVWGILTALSYPLAKNIVA
ncbi:hypothetical protein QL919_04450 [Psychrobacter sp. APC 3426]|uniref:hypothetical protein n=1 Tax=Psychrobacter sp. APC 3426 TaxID=3035177 RepID=UPI0025B3631D|nr:hypothetical protein [Psychrobacter sp. APC 3426]MDN3397972.1 hypothetical protein [Psychrobacter sp. APC 3426]